MPISDSARKRALDAHNREIVAEARQRQVRDAFALTVRADGRGEHGVFLKDARGAFTDFCACGCNAPRDANGRPLPPGSSVHADAITPPTPPAPTTKPARKLPVLGLDRELTIEERSLPAWQRPLPGTLARRARARGAELAEEARANLGTQLLAKAASAKGK